MKKKRLSLSGLLMIVIGCLVAGIFILCLLFNNLFLEKYYMLKKQQELQVTYTALSEAALSGDLEQDNYQETFDEICQRGNLIILIVGDNHTIVRSSVYNAIELERDLATVMFGATINSSDILVNKNEYCLWKQYGGSFGRGDGSMILYGVLGDGATIFMSTPIESIRESAAITNEFITWVSLVIFALSLVIIFFISRRLAKPIKDMSLISQAMANLDFEAKYKPSYMVPKEINSLGNDINDLSHNLESSISELKAANLALQQDIAHKVEIDEMRKDFVSNVSHELKTPLALISGYAEGLAEGISEDPESRAFYCEVIRDEAEKMTQMVKRLLTLNQLEFGNEPLEMSRFDITELVNGLVNSSNLLLDQNEISVSINRQSPMYVWGDEFKVEEVISNYLSNAIHYAAGDRKRIDISIEALTRENEAGTEVDNKVRVSVFNTGSYIPEEDLDKVWIKFYKVDKARTREYGGNGIGLSIVKAIMDSMNQKCGVCNHVDGVEFWMELDANN